MKRLLLVSTILLCSCVSQEEATIREKNSKGREFTNDVMFVGFDTTYRVACYSSSYTYEVLSCVHIPLRQIEK